MTNPKSAHFTKHGDQRVTQTVATTTRGNESCAGASTSGQVFGVTLPGVSSSSALGVLGVFGLAGSLSEAGMEAGGVAGATARLGRPSGEAGGVLGAFATIGKAGTLPVHWALALADRARGRGARGCRRARAATRKDDSRRGLSRS